jgi:hypothetical protein
MISNDYIHLLKFLACGGEWLSGLGSHTEPIYKFNVLTSLINKHVNQRQKQKGKLSTSALMNNIQPKIPLTFYKLGMTDIKLR